MKEKKIMLKAKPLGRPSAASNHVSPGERNPDEGMLGQAKTAYGLNHIRRYIKNNGGYLVMDDMQDILIPVARVRRKEFLAFLKTKRIKL